MSQFLMLMVVLIMIHFTLRVLFFCSRSRQMASLFDEGDFAFKKGSGYLERHKEYYEKNKDTIKERRRNYYYVKKEALTKKVGRFEFAKISAIKNLAEIPDPFEPYGRVKIENLSDFASAIAPKNNLTKSFKRRKAVNAVTSTTNEDISMKHALKNVTCSL